MISDASDLYVDLLIKCISNLIHGPPPKDPWTDGFFGPAAEPGRDRHSPVHSMVGILRLRNVGELAQRAIDQMVSGNFLEAGVWKGGCSILMRGVIAANGVADRTVYVADSFEGLPPPDTTLYPQDHGLDFHLVPELAVSLDEVRQNFDRYGLLDDQVVFVKGFFRKTLPSLDCGPLALLRLDGDLYESTHLALTNLYPKLSVGGFIIIDDYGAIQACREAVEDYRAAHRITEKMHQIDWTGTWWQKAA